MAQNDMLKRYLDAGVAFTKMSRGRAEGIINDLVKAGEVQRGQAQQRVDELVERSRRNTEQLVDMVRTEMRRQLGAMGLATKADIIRLERRIDAVTKSNGAKVPAAPRKAAAPKKAPAKKAASPKAGGAKKA
jgi:polyhydroxyalkanoate synthesis regulator phasin